MRNRGRRPYRGYPARYPEAKRKRRRSWEAPPQKVRALYPELRIASRYEPEYHGARGTLWEAGGTTLQG